MNPLVKNILLPSFLLSLQLAIPAEPPGWVIGWRENSSGQATGIPSSSSVGLPTSSTGLVVIATRVLSNAVCLAAGDAHVLAIKSDRTGVGWGWNRFGQATGVASSRPEHSNGAIALSGSILHEVTAISAGYDHSLALKSDGTVVAFGDNTNDKASVPPTLSNVVAISAGWTHSLALKRDGTVVGWGVPAMPLGLSNIVAIAAGRGTYGPNLALKSDGFLVSWGANGFLEPVPAGISNITAIAVGGQQCLAIKRGGTVIEWHPGDSLPTEIPGLTNVTQIAAAGEDLCLALRNDGTVVGWGGLRRPATVPQGLSNVVAIAVGDFFCAAITTNGAVAERFRSNSSK